MKHEILECDNKEQDEWASLYLAMSKKLMEAYGIEGKAVIREGIRFFAAKMAQKRKEELLEAGCKTNLETFFDKGYGFMCGNRARKEWIRHTEQEVFINMISCPLADMWKEDHEIGRMFCEEYYPVLVHEGTSEKAQINLGYCMLNDRDDSCRLSIYLRPANVPEEKRAECFPDFDTMYSEKKETPVYIPDFKQQKELLTEAFAFAAEEKIGEEAAEIVRLAAEEYVK